MNTIEFFCGTKSFSNVARSYGFNTFTIDSDARFNPDFQCDLLCLDFDTIIKLIEYKEIIWLSPPCTTFSLASGNKHWSKDRKPKTDEAIVGYELLMLSWRIADYCNEHNKIWFIENPNGRAVWFGKNEYLKRVWYCQYGDDRAKPTNIWTNLKGWNPKVCKNDNPLCNHIRAKRGSKTGTQGLKNSVIRSKIPYMLFFEIFDIILRNNEVL